MAAFLPNLLLLPAPPVPATRLALRAAYWPALDAALAQTKRADRSATLVVAVAAGSFLRRRRAAEADDDCRSTVAWPAAQALLAGLYALVAALCAERAIGSDVAGGPGAVDVRVVPVEDDESDGYRGGGGKADVSSGTIVLNLAAFAGAYAWHDVFYLHSAAGLRLRDAYRTLAQAALQRLPVDALVGVVGGDQRPEAIPEAVPEAVLESEPTPSSTPSHHTVCLGGTFDHLHPGHKLLLTAAALLLDVPASGSPCTYIIGITGDALLRKKQYAAYMQPWTARAANVLDFLATLLGGGEATTDDGGDGNDGSDGPSRRVQSFRHGSVVVECVRIDNPFGPTIERATMDCLVVSGETRSGGQAVNDKRVALGWAPLVIYEVDVLSGEEAEGDDAATTDPYASKISSTAIRKQKAAAAAAAAERRRDGFS